MADLLLKLDAPEKGEPKSESGSWTNLLSSHPDTPQRAMALKSGRHEACPN